MSSVELTEEQRECMKRSAQFRSADRHELEHVEPGLSVMSLGIRDELKQNHGVVLMGVRSRH